MGAKLKRDLTAIALKLKWRFTDRRHPHETSALILTNSFPPASNLS